MIRTTAHASKRHRLGLVGDQIALVSSTILLVITTVLVWGDTVGIGAVMNASGGIGVLDVTGSFTPHQAYDLLIALGVSGRRAYLSFVTGIDVLYPASYAWFGWCLFQFVGRETFSQSSTTRLLSWLPLAVAGCDYLENYFVYQMLVAFPKSDWQSAMMANVTHLSKFGFSALSVIALLILMFVRHQAAKSA